MKISDSLKSFFVQVLLPSQCINCGKLIEEGFYRSFHREKSFLYAEDRAVCPEIICLRKRLCYRCINSFPLRSQRLIVRDNMQIYALSDYKDVIRHCIVQLKFAGKTSVAEIMAASLSLFLKYSQEGRQYNPVVRRSSEVQQYKREDEFSETAEFSEILFVPIPLGKKRQLERGYNQVEKILQEAQKFCNLQYLNLLQRVRETKRQSECSNIQERQGNVKGIFSVRESFLDKSSFRESLSVQGLSDQDLSDQDLPKQGLSKQGLSDQCLFDKKIKTVDDLKKCKIVLIDDVFTTGATLKEAYNCLLKAGFEDVSCLALALAMPHQDD